MLLRYGRSIMTSSAIEEGPTYFFRLKRSDPLINFFNVPIRVLFPMTSLDNKGSSSPTFLYGNTYRATGTSTGTRSALSRKGSHGFVASFGVLRGSRVLAFVYFHWVVLMWGDFVIGMCRGEKVYRYGYQ